MVLNLGALKTFLLTARRDNLSSHLTYEEHWNELFNRQQYGTLDIVPSDLFLSESLGKSADWIRLPLLLKGSNNYCQQRLADYTKIAMPPSISSIVARSDVFFLAPENHSILEEYYAELHGAIAPRTGIRSLLSRSDPEWEATRIILRLLRYLPPTDSIRWFDSHMSLYSYSIIASIVADLLEVNTASFATSLPEIVESLERRVYAPDLATRFSPRRSTAAFPSNKHAQEIHDRGAQRGRFLIYRNCSAPDDRELFIFGDSHSYSTLAPMMSMLFQRVAFYWGSSRDAFDFMEHKRSTKNPLTMLEISERFFLRNIFDGQ